MKKSSQLKYAKSGGGGARSTSQTSLKDQSPPKKITEIDPLTTSQIVSDLAKSQQSFRSSQSPNGLSPTSKLNNSTGVRYQKRHSSIVSKQQLQTMHERSVIRLLGLNMEAVCSKPTHDKNKMLFICQLPDCKAENRLGCAYCQLEQHADHPTYNLEIQQFCRTFDQKYKDFQSQSSIILTPPNMNNQIKASFERLRQQVLEKILTIELSITQTINQFLIVEQKYNPLISRVDQFAKKNIFEMTQDELYEMIEFNEDKHIQQLRQITEINNQNVNEKQQQAAIVWENFYTHLEYDVLSALGDNSEIFLMDPNSREFATIKLQKQEQKKQRLEQMNSQFKEIVQKYQQEERLEKQRAIELEKQKKEQEIQKKRQIEIQQQQEILLKQNEEEQQEREKILKTFPHILYTEDCKHRHPCNTIPIFSCCNKAYPCATCHGYKSHPPRISVPSYRYCMKCLEIYLVIYPTNQAVNCLKCT